MTATPATPAATTGPAKEIAPFLRNLRRLLDTEHASVVCWTADGVAFEIHDLAQLVAHVLPKYFKHAKYSSFQRQLNYFHFRKWTRSKTAVCTFSNPHFQRDAPELTWRISRKKSMPSSAAKGLSIVVPSASGSPRRRKRVAPAEVDGLKSPTDATAMVHHHQQQQPLVYSPTQDEQLPWHYAPSAWQQLDWACPPHQHELPAHSQDEELPLDWIDALYSSL